MRPVAITSLHPRLRFERRALARAIHTLDVHHEALATRRSGLANDGELSLAFMTDPQLARLHDDFLDDPTVTDVITFNGDPALGTAGEICISADAALRHLFGSPARRKLTRAADAAAFSREVTLYVVHGWLHLAGYDDLAPAKKRIMRRAEARALAVLERANALPEFGLR